jgi:GntR family transcriptional regulator
LVVEKSKLQLGPVSPAAPGSLYQQIVDALKREVASGRLPPGTPLPSFRALGAELLVSLITVKRAYEDLEREGIIYCRQGRGTFVADQGPARTRAAQRESALQSMRAAVTAGRLGALSDQELLRLFREQLTILGDESKGSKP